MKLSDILKELERKALYCERDNLDRKLLGEHILSLCSLVRSTNSEVERLTALVRKMQEALENYGWHIGDCTTGQWRRGEPTKDGRYRTLFGYGTKQAWFYGDERPKCECGYDRAINIEEVLTQATVKEGG